MEALTFLFLAICVGLLLLEYALKKRVDHHALCMRVRVALLVVATIFCLAGLVCGITFVSAGIDTNHLQR
jgi:hypothetical protein